MLFHLGTDTPSQKQLPLHLRHSRSPDRPRDRGGRPGQPKRPEAHGAEGNAKAVSYPHSWRLTLKETRNMTTGQRLNFAMAPCHAHTGATEPPPPGSKRCPTWPSCRTAAPVAHKELSAEGWLGRKTACHTRTSGDLIAVQPGWQVYFLLCVHII